MRGDQGVVKEQLKTVQEPKKLAALGFEEGIGFVPFAGIGYSVYKRVIKADSGGLRAAAAKRLALDPDPLSAQALVAATQDKHWLVRAAALEAISQRGDPTLLPKIILPLDDEKDEVRFAAAACIVHLSGLSAKPRPAAGARE
jgi:HEAT repeat protein